VLDAAAAFDEKALRLTVEYTAHGVSRTFAIAELARRGLT
jgi:hypothetical protein